MNTIKVLQLGATDLRASIEIADGVEWYYETDVEELPDKDLDVAILTRGITWNEYEYLSSHLRAYCLFVPNELLMPKGSMTERLFQRKKGRRLSDEELSTLLKKELLNYFSGSYGEKLQLENISISQGFQGSIFLDGFQGVELKGDYGIEWSQAFFWRINIPMAVGRSIDFWLEYEKDPTVEIMMRFTQIVYGSVAEVHREWTFSESEMEDIICLESITNPGSVFVSLYARGNGRLKIVALHDRFSRRGCGCFLPGGERSVTSGREELFHYFDPGNRKPPLCVYFSGYKTQEGFEGYYMMRRFGHPFLLISESRLEGGAFYMGSEEYENQVVQVIEDHLQELGFDNSQLILSGLSMGTYGALYYGCRLRPHTILLGKPLANIGDVAANERINRAGGFPTSLDILKKFSGSVDEAAVDRLNSRFWDAFDQADWSHTQFAVAYMIEDDYDSHAYGMLQSHLKDAGVRIYGKGLHGRHNDDTRGIVGWFVNQYKKILERDFDRYYSDEIRNTGVRNVAP